MKRRLQILIGLGVVVLFFGLVYWSRQTGNLSRALITLEPTYEGETFSYWMAHWYQKYGQPNLQAHEAIKTMGSKSAPYLGEMMAKRAMVDAGTPDFNYYEPLLQAFEVLGPNAQPATPYLIKSLGLNFDCSERALISIGKGAVPPLADKLLATLRDTRNPFYQGAIRMGVHKDSGFFIRGQILSVFDRMGTNAEAALPALAFAASTNLPIYHVWLNRQNFYATLAIVGRNHPEVVVPTLLKKFASSAEERGDIAKAIALMGTNQTEVFIPVLIAALSDKSTDANSRPAIGEALTVISAANQETLLPVFLAALTNQSNPEPIRCYMARYLAAVGHDEPDIVIPALLTAYTNASLYGRSSIAGALASFGDRARSVVPLLLADCEREIKPHNDNGWRIQLAIAAKTIAPDNAATLVPLFKDLDNSAGFVRQQTISALARLGTNGMEAVPALLKCLSHSDNQTRIDATRALNRIGVDSDEYINALGKNLSCPNEFMVQEAEVTLVTLTGHSELAFVTLAKSGKATFLLGQVMLTNTPALLKGLDNTNPQVRLGTLEIFNEFRTPIARPHIVPEAIPKLKELSTNDPDLKVRERAADILYWLGG